MSILFTFLFIVTVTFVTRNVLLSLGLGLVLSSLLATDFAVIPAISLIANKLWIQLDFKTFFNFDTFLNSWSLFVFMFIFLLGLIIELMQRGGLFMALQKTIAKIATKAMHVEILSLSLSKIFMLDDYLSCLAVGSIMTKSFDKFKLTRTKLAFLIDSMSAPLALLCPISSWSVIIVGVFKSAAFTNSHLAEHFSGNPLTQFFYVLPYLFYSFIIISACWFIVLRRISFGNIDAPQYVCKEQIGQSNNDVRFIHFLVPFVSLIAGVLIFNLMLGHYKLFGGNNSMLEAFQSANSAAALCFACFVSASITMIWMLKNNIIKLPEVPQLLVKGWKGVYMAILILWLSWSMSSILTQNLNIGATISEMLGSDIPFTLLPVIFFALAMLTGFITGTSWGTVGIVSPIVISIFDHFYVNSGMTIDPQLLMVCIGATISGSICGDHLSPLCSTTVMAASSVGISPIVHSRTQFFYTIPIALSTVVAFYFAAKFTSYGLLVSSIGCVVGAIVLCCTILSICSWLSKRAKQKEFGLGLNLAKTNSPG
jgi:Na+/H+ antiporter NhaC